MVSQQLRSRPATPKDVDALAHIIYDAMPMDPQWDYRFPRRKQFPQDNFACARQMFRSMLEEEKTVINVVTFSTPCEAEEEWTPQALAVWNIEFDLDNGKHVNAGQPRRDANFEHMRAFGESLQAAKKTYFNCTQLHLRVLATHPDYQRRGAGKMLVSWGMELGRVRGIPVTLFSSPMGQQLYSYLGFDYLGNVVVQVDGEEESLNVGAMMYRPSGGVSR